MRVHTCRHCGEVFPSYPDLRQHLDSHVQPPIGHTCTPCKKSFTRREYLLKHSSRCRPKPFACDVCHSLFERKDNLDQHKRTVQCGSPPQPEPSAPKRRRIALNEDPLSPPPVEQLDDELSSDLQDAVRDNWGSIRTYVAQGPVQTRYNHRLTTMDTRELQEPLRQLFEEQTTDFKVNLSFGFILKQKVTGRLRYYHSSNNCCGRLLEEPSLITNRGDFDRFLARIQESDILQWAIAQRPNSDWVCEHKEEYVNTRLAGRSWTATESCCLARKAFDKRTPGLFKVEWCGKGFIGLCSKTYYCFGSTNKSTTKGLNKRQNDIDKDAFLNVLMSRRSGSGFNRGFRVHNSSMMTYVQERAALTYFYPKRKVLADGLSTAPLDL